MSVRVCYLWEMGLMVKTVALEIAELKRENARLRIAAGLVIDNCNACGKPIKGWPNVFRCVTPGCDRIYHRECLLMHCAKETADLIAERDRLKEDLRILTQGRFVQS